MDAALDELSALRPAAEQQLALSAALEAESGRAAVPQAGESVQMGDHGCHRQYAIRPDPPEVEQSLE